jgi:hypothetical protein
LAPVIILAGLGAVFAWAGVFLPLTQGTGGFGLKWVLVALVLTFIAVGLFEFAANATSSQKWVWWGTGCPGMPHRTSGGGC